MQKTRQYLFDDQLFCKSIHDVLKSCQNASAVYKLANEPCGLPPLDTLTDKF
jgi:hypothetical protein